MTSTEQRAKLEPDVEAAIKRGIARWRTSEDEYIDCQGFLTMTVRNEVVKLLAAALAACARETLQQAEKACEALYAQPISCAEVGMCIEAIRALERAAGESK